MTLNHFLLFLRSANMRTAISAAYIACYILGRFILDRYMVGTNLTLHAILYESLVVIFVLCLGRVLAGYHVILGGTFLTLVSLFHAANLDMVFSLQTVIHLREASYGAEKDFILSSLFHPTFMLYSFMICLIGLLFSLSWSISSNKIPHLLASASITFILLMICTPLSIQSHVGRPWEVSSLAWHSLSESFFPAGTHSDNASGLQAKEEADSFVSSETTAPDERTQPNILLVVLEGIPGIYLEQVQKETGIEYPVTMEKLSTIAEDFLVLPNMVSHNRQTIRGLYSMFTGDYPAFSLTTPKAYQFMNLSKSERPPVLPEILSDSGYTTVFLQAADLGYMSKDQFMESLGFQDIYGKDYFDSQYVPFNWGPDDKAFFEGALDMVKNLSEKKEPWFLTLLNVGTHHPYGVTEKYAAKHNNRQVAAVHYLDSAIDNFMAQLKQLELYDDTIIIFAADESHGVSGQPFGRFWPLVMLRSPETEPGINPACYGLIDIPYTILDLLGTDLPDDGDTHKSMRKEYTGDRGLLFGQYAVFSRGTVYETLKNGDIKAFTKGNSNLYANEYTIDTYSGSKAENIRNRIADLYPGTRKQGTESSKMETHLLINKKEYSIAASRNKTISTGQYLSIPGNSVATIELSAEVPLKIEETDRDNSRRLSIGLQLTEEGKPVDIDIPELPVIGAGERLEFSFSFSTKESLSRIWVVLSAKNGQSNTPALLQITRFAVTVSEGELMDEPSIINTLNVDSIEE